MKILFLSRWYPYPADNGSKLRIFNLIRQLARRHEIHLLSFTAEPVSVERQGVLSAFCRQVQVAPHQPFRPWRRQALAGLFDLRPRAVVDTYSPAMAELAAAAACAHSFDAIIASQIDMAPYALLPGLNARVRILEELELTTLYEEPTRAGSLSRRWWARLTRLKAMSYTRRLLRGFDACTVVSESERALVRRLAPAATPVEVVPNGISPAEYTPLTSAPEPDTLIYSGALTYRANFDAVDYFLREIFPQVQAARPDVKLRVSGRAEAAQTDRLPQDPHVIYTGHLDDIRPAISMSWASVVPLRIGGGTRLKILEALALGTPVVTTPKGVEGLELAPGRDLLVAENPRHFAAATIELLNDPALRSRLAGQGRASVLARYDWERIVGVLEGLLDAAPAPARWMKAVAG